MTEKTQQLIEKKAAEIEEILGFELPEGFRRNRSQWYRNSGGYRSLSDAWTLQLYKIGHIDMGLQKVWFEAQFEDAEMVVIPRFIAEHKVPLKAKYEIEHFLQWIMKKYCLGDGEGRKRKGKI